MEQLFGKDLAYVQSVGFGGFAEAAAPEIIRLLRSAPAHVRRVVDEGCGAGPLTAALAAAGFEVTGVDDSAELLTIARAVVPGASFIHGSLYETPIAECEAIVALGEALTYHSDLAMADMRVAMFFRRASEILPEGGMLIFDMIELGEPSLDGRNWTSGADWAVLSETSEDQASRMLVRKIQTFRRVGEFYRRETETHNIRLLETPALLKQLADCGFSVETATAYGSHKLSPRRRAFFCTRIRRS